MYGLLYTLVTRVAPIRVVGLRCLSLISARRMLRRVRERDPDVVVSTHPSLTNILGILRRRGKIDMPVVATITDLADHILWAHRHCDMHLVCYEQAVERIEPITGPGSVVRVRPLVSPQFLEPCDRADARERLDLPADDPIVLVSGGGWGVGDLDGAVQTALDSVPGSLVVVLAGRNEEVQERLEGAFGREPRVRVLGFTKEMSDLMGAADAIIHSTGGVTALEALLRQCPVISYGAPWGHSRVNARIAEAQGLGQRAESLDELSAALRNIFDPVDPWQVPLVPPAPAGGAARAGPDRPRAPAAGVAHAHDPRGHQLRACRPGAGLEPEQRRGVLARLQGPAREAAHAGGDAAPPGRARPARAAAARSARCAGRWPPAAATPRSPSRARPAGRSWPRSAPRATTSCPS